MQKWLWGIVAGFSCWQITFDFWGFKPVTWIRWLHLDIKFKWTRHCGSIHRSWLLLIGYTVNYWDEPISERLCGFCTIFVIEAICLFFLLFIFSLPVLLFFWKDQNVTESMRIYVRSQLCRLLHSQICF